MDPQDFAHPRDDSRHIGAGTGRDAAALAARGYATTAVEPVREMREVARRLHPDPAITWLDDSLPSPSRLAGPFDLILLSAVWMHLAETERPGATPTARAARRCPGVR